MQTDRSCSHPALAAYPPEAWGESLAADLTRILRLAHVSWWTPEEDVKAKDRLRYFADLLSANSGDA